jgi:hypothetical protein
LQTTPQLPQFEGSVLTSVQPLQSCQLQFGQLSALQSGQLHLQRTARPTV